MGSGPPAGRIGVVMPARNEAAYIEACLRSLRPFLDRGDPVLVVDACSVDQTATLARRAGARVLASPQPERGYALARGFAELAGRVDVVLLAHADMRFASETRSRVLAALGRHPAAPGGALGHRIEDAGPLLRAVERGNRFRARRWWLPYGDQAQFVRTRAVEAAGGFPWMPEMEDLELALRLRGLGPLLYLDCPVWIPRRHWAGGVLRATLRNWLKALRYRLQRRVPSHPVN